MGAQSSKLLLIIAAGACFVEAATFHRNDPGPALTIIMGFLCLVKGLGGAPISISVIVSACVAAAVFVAGDEGFININSRFWVVVTFLIVIIIFREGVYTPRK